MSKWMSMDELRKKEEEERGGAQEFYSGGNDRRSGGGSGLATLGPPKDRDPNDPFQRIVENAKSDAASQAGGVDSADSDMIKLTLYRNGFTVDDGPLRDLESPENKSFLQNLTQGYVPHELVQQRKEKGITSPVNVAISDRRQEDYRPPTPPPYVAFGGEGSSLGGGNVESGGALIDPSSWEGGSCPEVDTSKPTTMIQVKLVNGKKLKVKLNKDHTVRDLVAMIVNRSDGEGRNDAPYFISAGFPPKDLENLSSRLTDAGVVGASISQRLA